MFSPFTHRTKAVCANPQLLHKEEEHIRDALIRYKYPTWVLNRLKSKNNHKYSNTQACSSSRDNSTSPNNTNNQNNHSFIHMVVPYTKGLSKSFKNICGKVGIQVHSMWCNTIKSLLVAPMYRTNITQKSGVICRYMHNRLECDEYIGMYARTFGER